MATKLEFAIRDKMSALTEKLDLLESNQASEDKFLDVIAHVKLLKAESRNKEKLLEAKEEELEMLREVVEDLKIDLLKKSFVVDDDDDDF